MPGDIFDIANLPQTALTRAVVTAARPFLRAALGLADAERLYGQISSSDPDTFAARALRVLRVGTVCPEADLAHIPCHGPLIVAANHPHGALDGLVLAALLRRLRPDVRLLANHWLAGIPQMADIAFFVDPFGGSGSGERSRAGLRAAHLWVRRGGALVVFPAGAVAHEWNGGHTPVDAPWLPTVGRLAAATGAALVPVRIKGRNSQLFYRAGRLHSALRTALLGRELLGKQGATVRVRIGPPVARPDDLTPTEDGRRLADAARAAMERLGASITAALSAAESIAVEIAALPREACLVESGPCRVFCVGAAAIPQTLDEIGRLREIAYRAVGEGTGGDRDVDAFDARYLHLFCWDAVARQIVGAYRLGRIDAIVEAEGVEGLYTRTLFRYDRDFVDRLGPALELGRSFVREEYQRNHSALLLLWKGIARFVSLHPKYRVLLGPVSISARYSDASHALLTAFLEQNHRAHEVADLVASVRPPAARRAPTAAPVAVPRTAEAASRLVAQLEPDGKGMPVLLRQYLKLNARLLAFNVDPHFHDALDALMMVDLTTVDRAMLNRYFGKEGAEAFLGWHARASSPRAA